MFLLRLQGFKRNCTIVIIHTLLLIPWTEIRNLKTKPVMGFGLQKTLLSVVRTVWFCEISHIFIHTHHHHKYFHSQVKSSKSVNKKCISKVVTNTSLVPTAQYYAVNFRNSLTLNLHFAGELSFLRKESIKTESKSMVGCTFKYYL